jgi:glycosyltransferase involved in cell wall biosynthesis
MAGKPHNVLLLNYEFPPMGGGAGNASFQIARCLVAAGHRVDVVTSRIAGQPSLEEIEGVRVHRVRSFRRGIQECGMVGAWSYLAFAWPVCRRLARERRYDVVHYFFGLPTGLLSLVTPGLGRLPGVVSLRGSDVPGYDASSPLLRLAHALLLPLTRRVWRRADAVVANSLSLREQALRACPGLAIGMIPNGIDTESFKPADPAARAARAGRPPVRLLSVARLIPRKGLDHLLDAMAQLRDERVDLTLQGCGRDAERLRRQACELGLEGRVHFAGFKERALLPAVYAQADVFVLPSLSESCAMALLEAMACGLPAVVTDVGGMAEHVEQEANGLRVPAAEPRALAEALRRLVRDPELRRAMGERNAERIRAGYSWDAVAARYLDVYAEAIAHRAAAGRPAPLAAAIGGAGDARR